MTEHEDLEARFRRLREGTDLLVLPANLIPRVLSTLEQSAGPSGWIVELLSIGRWALIPASLAPAVLVLALVLGGGWIGEAVFLASSMTEYMP